MMGERHPVVVGVDGSVAALGAVSWAAEEARRRGAPLRLVYAFELPFRYPPGVVEQDSLRDALRREKDGYLEAARAQALQTAPDLGIEAVTVDGTAVEVLVRESETAAVVVVATRGHGGFTGLLLGSTSVGLAGRAHCPVVVVRGASDGGPVVVGVDGTPVGEAAIAFAFEQAAALGTDLVAVHSWTDPALANALAAGYLAVDFGLLEEQATVVLAERLAGWQEKYPQVRVTRQLVRDHPTRALLHYADRARLVVVGSRGRGGFAGLVLGSTSQHLMHHAACPVAVVRTEAPHGGAGVAPG
ncbi:universal stress protein [Actinophytocola xanthii]|uniref:UspA domain-containing protein n=1 Tax=Actinophytocola xanthii TaxID=1912961 RepID=A0A1Q8CPW4_9PSEU|nr:universal stress protein [Actinophytocola xanthii]OLF16379.1 hypothetical protein BU204_17195 [Actinophytocola xanthii]